MVNDRGVVVAPDRVAVGFDDERLVADAGIVLPAALAGRLGVEALVDGAVDLGARVGAARAGQGDDARLGDGARCRLDRRLRHPALGVHRDGARPPRPRALDARDLPARFHLRPRPPGRPGARPGDRARLAGGRRPGRLAAYRRRRLVRRRGARLPKAGRQLRPHSRARLSPAARRAGRHRRGAAHPPAQGLGQHPARRAALHRGARGAREPRGGERREAAARRLGLLEPKGLRAAPTRRLALLGRGDHPAPRSRGDRSDPRERLADPVRLPRHERGADRGDPAR
jgi:hypothetical protein